MIKKLGKVVLCLSIILLTQIAEASVGVKVGEEAPDFTLKDIDGKSVSLKDFRGKKIVILDFWASWCGPCRKSIPELNKLQKDYAEKDVEVLGINVGEKPATVVSAKKRLMVKYPIVLDLKSQVTKDYRVSGIPTLILIDKDGVVHYNGHNPRQLGSELKKLVE